MNLRNLPLNGLKTFESFGRHLHMGKAAEELGVTHSAVSHQIKKLENHFRVELIFREGKSSKLTARGKQLLEEIQKGFARLQQATLNLDPELISGNIRLGCTSALCTNWLLPIMSDFFAAHPNINFELSQISLDSNDIADDIDLAICYGKPHTSRLTRKLMDIHLFPVANGKLAGYQSKTWTLKDIISLPILLDEEKNWEDLIATSPLDADYLRQTHSIRFFDSSHAIAAAKQGLGVALADQMEVWQDLAEGKLVRLESHRLDTGKAYYLLTDKQPVRRVSLFADWLIEKINQRNTR